MVRIVKHRTGLLRNDDWSQPLGAPNGAWISECKKYRTLLWRTFEDNPASAPLMLTMLNPSNADHTEDDPTIRRAIGFAKREGCGGLIVVNLSPYRTSDPKKLHAAHGRRLDVMLSQKNDDAVRQAAQVARVALFAWGGNIRPWMEDAVKSVRSGVHERRLTPKCLGRTLTGHPRHPLYVRANTRLLSF